MPETIAPATASLGGAHATEQNFNSLFDRIAAGEADPPKAQPAEPAKAEAPKAEPMEAQEPAALDVRGSDDIEPVDPSETPAYTNLDDYLTKSGLERDSFYSLPVAVKIDGQTRQVALQDVLKSYQLEGHVNRKSIELAEAQKVWESEQAQAKQILQQNLQHAQTLGNLAHQQLLAEYQGVDWNKLRAEDPTQWAVMNQEFQMRAGAIQQQLAQVNQAQQQQQQAAQAEQAKALKAEQEKLLDARPEWREPAKFQAARAEMVGYARQVGIPEAELAGIVDHRHLLILHDAARFAALQAKKPEALKRVRAAPQMAAPGARTTSDPKQVARTNLKQAFLKNPTNKDLQVRYFETLA